MFNLGGGLPGSVPLLMDGNFFNIRGSGSLLGGGGGSTGGSGMDGASGRGISRLIFIKAFGNDRTTWGSDGSGKGTSQLMFKDPLCGPFRAAYSAGDVLTSLSGGGQSANPKYGPIANQVGGVGFPVNISYGGVNKSGKATYTGNPRYVYDSSDFIKFKKIKAIGNLYNDKSFGGDIIQNQRSALARVR